MEMKMKVLRIVCLVTVLLLAVLVAWAGGRSEGSGEDIGGDIPQGIHLTWSTTDVYRTMTISWWTESSADSTVKYDTRSGPIPLKPRAYSIKYRQKRVPGNTGITMLSSPVSSQAERTILSAVVKTVGASNSSSKPSA